MQALDGGFDGAHASYLHRVVDSKTPKAGTRRFWIDSPTPRSEVELTDYGYLCASIHRLNDIEDMVWTAQFVMPFHQIRSSFVAGVVQESMVEGHMWVPMDDENCMVYNWMYMFGDKDLQGGTLAHIEQARGRGSDEQTADFRKVRNKDNDWLIDRHVQKYETYTGMEGINTQDHAITESMGPIVDRTQEHLGTTDRPVIAARHLLLQSVQKVQQGGDPMGLKPTYYGARAMGRVIPKNVRWFDAMKTDLCPGVKAMGKIAREKRLPSK